MCGGQTAQRQGDGSESVAVVVDGVDAYRSGAVGAVDDSQESLLGGTFRLDQRETVLLCKSTRCRGEKQCEGQEGAESSAPVGEGSPIGPM